MPSSTLVRSALQSLCQTEMRCVFVHDEVSVDQAQNFQVHKIHSCKPLAEAVEQRIIVCPKKDKHLGA